MTFHTQTPLFKTHNILKLNDIYLFNLGVFMIQLTKNDLPEVFQNMFSTNNQYHN